MSDEVMCDAIAADCICYKPFGHEGVHECRPECDGAWEGTEPNFTPVRLPQEWTLYPSYVGPARPKR